ncbi:SDR family NAD(P)-dependent oxidoreductase [Paracoccaceae bacterium GXU_MW_L88]
MNSTALITGASSGIGRELARIHAKKGGDVVAIASRQPGLDALKEELEAAHGISVHVIAKDLSKPGAGAEIYDEVKAAGIEISTLINNAGFGGQGAFHEREWERDRAMINVNIMALTELTRLFLPDLIARGSGRILNVSSTAGEMPGPLQAVYYATKAYVTSFSNAIAEELKDTGVTVTALLPGATETGFSNASGLDKTDLFAKTASAEDVAKAGYEAMEAGKLDVVAGVSTMQRAMIALAPLLPKRMLMQQVAKLQETKA